MQTADTTQCWIDERGSVACVAKNPETPTPAAAAYCVELGDGDPATGRYIAVLHADAAGNELDGRQVQVELVGDGSLAVAVLPGRDEPVTLAVCVVEDATEAVPCCVRGGEMWCPERPEFHGMPVAEAVHAGALRPCREEIPTTGRGCCVQLGEQGAILVCADPSDPRHGYELGVGEFHCLQVALGQVCVVQLADGRQVKLPVCPPQALPPEPCDVGCADEAP